MTYLPLGLVLLAVVLLVLAIRRLGDRPAPPRFRPIVTPQRLLTAEPVEVIPAPARQVRRDVPHALYQYLTPAGAPKYFGISNDPGARHERRMRQFAAGDPKVAWVAETTREMQVLAWYDDHAAANAAERIMVRAAAEAGHDLANDHYNPNRRSRRAA